MARTNATTWTAMALAMALTTAASACAADGKPPEPAPPTTSPQPPAPPQPPAQPPAPPAMPSYVTITTPASQLPLPAFSSLPAVLELTVTAIDNPAEQAFSLRVSMQAPSPSPSGASSVELGGFAPYPASKPGTFVLRLPEAARALLQRAQANATITVALEPIDAARPLREPLRVTLGARTWQ